jgi:ribosomal protein S18 acetylase RimI-like enzyme
LPVGRLYVDRRDDEIRILDIALIPEARGGGIGGLLLGDLIAEAGSARKPIRIHVERANRALSLYQRLGFSEIGQTDFYYLMEWNPGANSA